MHCEMRNCLACSCLWDWGPGLICHPRITQPYPNLSFSSNGLYHPIFSPANLMPSSSWQSPFLEQTFSTHQQEAEDEKLWAKETCPQQCTVLQMLCWPGGSCTGGPWEGCFPSPSTPFTSHLACPWIWRFISYLSSPWISHYVLVLFLLLWKDILTMFNTEEKRVYLSHNSKLKFICHFVEIKAGTQADCHITPTVKIREKWIDPSCLLATVR